MNSRIIVATIVFLALGCSLVCAQPQPTTFFKNRIGLTDAEIQQIGLGQDVCYQVAVHDLREWG